MYKGVNCTKSLKLYLQMWVGIGGSIATPSFSTFFTLLFSFPIFQFSFRTIPCVNSSFVSSLLQVNKQPYSIFQPVSSTILCCAKRQKLSCFCALDNTQPCKGRKKTNCSFKSRPCVICLCKLPFHPNVQLHIKENNPIKSHSCWARSASLENDLLPALVKSVQHNYRHKTTVL